MKRRSAMIAAGSFIGICVLILAGIWYYTTTNAFMQQAGAMAAEKAGTLLATKVDVGRIHIDSLHSLTVDQIVLYDKQGQEMAQAESARVRFSLLSMLRSDPAAAVDNVKVKGLRARLEQRSDGTWNYADLVSDNAQSSSFHGKVQIEDGLLMGRMEGKELTLEHVDAQLDFAKMPSFALQARCMNKAAELNISGTLGGDRQTLSVDGTNLEVGDYLDFIPADKLPEGVQIISGHVENASIAVIKDTDGYTYNGQAKLSNGQVRVMDTEIQQIASLVTFTEKDVTLFASAEANEQKASVHGKVYWDEDVPRLELVVESQGLDPGRLLANSPFHGKVAFTANVYGTIAAPKVEGDFKSPSGNVYGYDFQNARAQVHYENDCIEVKGFAADVFGGHLQGDGECMIASRTYNGHLHLQNMDAGTLSDFIPGIEGRMTADLGIHGMGNDFDALSIYGSASLADANYQGMHMSDIHTSFYKNGNEIKLDYLSAVLDHGGKFGLEGTIIDKDKLDLAFYGSGIDLAVLQHFVPEADVSGTADLKGTVHGDLVNPDVQIALSAEQGKLFQQPYHSLQCSASGSLDGLQVDSFSLENGGKEVWQVKGMVGFTGERRIDLTIDTMGARMEDIAALVAPDQPITGNVDNIIHFTGTLDNIDAVGYIHFYRGSYRGVILSGMDGDYTLHDHLLTVHDFHVYSPYVDMDLNGTLDPENHIDFKVAAHDVNLERLGSMLPYPVSGHGTFNGNIGGSLDAPLFAGTLDAPAMVFNGQKVENAHGEINYRGQIVHMDRFSFTQNGGTYALDGSANIASQGLEGRLTVQNGDMNALMAMFNLKNELLTGRIDGTLDLGGTLDNPAAHLIGLMAVGGMAGYEIDNTALDVSLANHVITIDNFTGTQGIGQFAAQGTIPFYDTMNVQISAKDIDAGILAKAAGMDAKVRGYLDAEAQFSGTLDNPAADVSLEIDHGGMGAATFDSLTGMLNLRNGIINVDQFFVQKALKDHNYKASATGSIPLKAITAGASEDMSDDYTQINLLVSLDDANLSLLPIFSKNVDWALGETDGSVRITGTLAHPLFDGSIGVKDGAVKLKSLSLPFTDMQADISFAGNKASVNNFSGRLGSGTYKLQGSTYFAGLRPVNYDFSLDADKLEIGTMFYKGPLSGSLHLQEGEIFGHKLPRLSGNVTVEHAVVSIPSIPEGDSGLPNVLLDVDLKLGKKVHFYSALLYDMQLAGAAHFGGSIHHPHPSGTISVLRGTVSYLKTSFKVREGEARFDQVNSFAPSIKLRADTKLNRAKVYLSIDGPADQMQVQLRSDPEMSETEIIQLLTLRSNYRGGQDSSAELGSLLDVGLQMSLLSSLESSMMNTLNLDEFTIVRDTDTKGHKSSDNSTHEVYNIKMGKYISDKVMLEYTQSVGSNKRKYGVQYDFNDHMSFTADLDQDNDAVFGLEARVHF